MDGWFRVSSGQLRDSSPEQACFAVNYAVRINVRQQLTNAGTATQKRIINIDIDAGEQNPLPDGTYFLEENGNTLFRVARENSAWYALCPGCVAQSCPHRGPTGRDAVSAGDRRGACPHSCIHSLQTCYQT